MDWIGWIEKVGLVSSLALIICSMFFFILKWVLEQFKIELIANRQDRKDYLDALHSIKEKLSEHEIRAKEFQCNVTLEHREMIKNLGEITVTLGRINGFRHE